MDAQQMMDRDLSAYKVLVVDDINLNLLLVRKMLGKYNFVTITAMNGQEALEKIESEKPVLVLLDLMMPVLDGYDVIRRVRADGAYKNLRIVVLSALNTNENVVKALNLGADEFLTKPITMEKLYESVNTQFEMILAMEADSRG
ncbi:MAG: response regulator [Bacteroidaceae bacterium]|mgnify:CR=1 FL=1|nr:response regulator [Candidatus Colenecus caballi]MCQ2073319.1 response regulator [Bacteroidaceae bacterium]